MDAILAKLKGLLIELSRKLEAVFTVKYDNTPPIIPSEPKISPETNETSEPYKWDNYDSSRHSVRVICDEMGLTLAEKNLIAACIMQESQFNNNAIGRNKDKDGRVLSTDWGICQINDYWHVGTGKRWSSVAQIVNNPDKAVKWMIQMYKQGLLKLWVSYSSGAYKKYLGKV
ncbi:MAG: transglycosylase SLT domain-containing protein [Candidatus Taylorbacteria bacterium]|nr:transglycosylase SLT domain-containing protein [Candidatus Taylorbacteria bacterium]